MKNVNRVMKLVHGGRLCSLKNKTLSAERDPRSLHCPISPLAQTQLGLDETLFLGLMG